MGASHVKMTRSIVNMGTVITYDPSDILTQGLNSDGTILFVDSVGELTSVWLHLFDAPYESYTNAYGPYAFPVGQTVRLTDVITDVPNLAGMYLWTSMNNKSLPIVAPYSACGAPTSVTLGKTLSSGEQVQLSWSGASAGNSNAITGYEVYRYESSDGASWGSGVRVGSVSTSATSGSLMVDPPSTYGNYYRFSVRTLGAAGASYYSGWTNSGNTLRRNHAPFGAWTDPTLTAGSTKVKAVHLSEMQTRVNTLLAFYGKSTRSFTGCTSGATSLANWLTCITELRNAIDSLGVSHDTWIAVTVNKPTAAVMEQLRTVIMAI